MTAFKIFIELYRYNFKYRYVAESFFFLLIMWDLNLDRQIVSPNAYLLGHQLLLFIGGQKAFTFYDIKPIIPESPDKWKIRENMLDFSYHGQYWINFDYDLHTVFSWS